MEDNVRTEFNKWLSTTNLGSLTTKGCCELAWKARDTEVEALTEQRDCGLQALKMLHDYAIRAVYSLECPECQSVFDVELDDFLPGEFTCPDCKTLIGCRIKVETWTLIAVEENP